MRQRLGVRTAFYGGKLCGAFVQLRGHLSRFVRRTTERDEQLRELLEFGFGHADKFNHGCRPMDTDKIAENMAEG